MRRQHLRHRRTTRSTPPGGQVAPPPTTPEPIDEPTPEPDAFETACRAPFTSLHVDQLGDVRPCCQSTRVLGNIAETSLGAIWTGESLVELRAAVEVGDLSKGCEHCEWGGRGGRDNTYAVRFDHDRLPDNGAGPVRLELAPSNACNLQCEMCNGEWSSSIRLHREKLPALPRLFGSRQLAEVADLADGVDELHLFGGEPLLMPEALQLLDIAADHEIRCVITTNGSVLTDRVERLIDRRGVDLVVSVDGTSESVYESIRRGASWSVLGQHLDRFCALAARHGNRVDIAHCLMTANWHEFPDHLAWAEARGLEVYVNDVLSPVEMSLHHLSPPELGSIIAQLRRRGDEIDELGGPWQATWERTLAQLEQTLDDGDSGERHAHLGQLSTSTPVLAEADETIPLAQMLRERSRDAVASVILTLDRDLRVASTHHVGTTDRFGLRTDGEVLGQLSSAVRTLLVDEAPPAARSVLAWDREAAVEERRYHAEPVALTERRSIRSDPAGMTLRFDYWFAPSDEDERETIGAAAAEGRYVEFELDTDNRLTRIAPADLADELGLGTTLGTVCFQPGDLVLAHLIEPPPMLTADEIEPGLVAIELRWAHGHHLIALARASTERTLVRIARPA